MKIKGEQGDIFTLDRFDESLVLSHWHSMQLSRRIDDGLALCAHGLNLIV